MGQCNSSSSSLYTTYCPYGYCMYNTSLHTPRFFSPINMSLQVEQCVENVYRVILFTTTHGTSNVAVRSTVTLVYLLSYLLSTIVPLRAIL